MANDVRRRLRALTSADHERLEARLDILSRLARPRDRLRLVQGFHDLHVAAEAAAAPWVSRLDGLDFEARRRSPLLARDLAALGGAPRPGSAPPIEVGGVGESLGLMYVLEGSVLGGQVVRRRVSEAGGDMTGLRFLDPYGARLGQRWRAFLAVLDAAAATPGMAAQMAAGAVAGFRHAEHRLCAEPCDA